MDRKQRLDSIEHDDHLATNAAEIVRQREREGKKKRINIERIEFLH